MKQNYSNKTKQQFYRPGIVNFPPRFLEEQKFKAYFQNDLSLDVEVSKSVAEILRNH